MRKKLRQAVDFWRGDYQRRTFLSSAAAAVINLAFTGFNGVLGFVSHSMWNCAISVYYLLLICDTQHSGVGTEQICEGRNPA